MIKSSFELDRCPPIPLPRVTIYFFGLPQEAVYPTRLPLPSPNRVFVANIDILPFPYQPTLPLNNLTNSFLQKKLAAFLVKTPANTLSNTKPRQLIIGHKINVNGFFQLGNGKIMRDKLAFLG